MIRVICVCLALFFTQSAVIAVSPQNKKGAQQADLTFSGVNYHHRWSQKDQHEYTPSGQEDLKAWKDMLTTHRYVTVKDGDGLASTASAVLEHYKAGKATVVRTDSIPRTTDKPAEHLIVVLFARPEFIEAAFARFKLREGTGTSLVYSHRVYGKKAGNDMSAWLKKNGPSTEKSLMGWDGAIVPPAGG